MGTLTICCAAQNCIAAITLFARDKVFPIELKKASSRKRTKPANASFTTCYPVL